jgi:hypothetical protein
MSTHFPSISTNIHKVMWTDIDYMNLRQDFTTDPDRFPIPKMRELVTTIHQRDQRYILILDPGIHAVGNYSSYQNGIDLPMVRTCSVYSGLVQLFGLTGSRRTQNSGGLARSRPPLARIPESISTVSGLT